MVYQILISSKTLIHSLGFQIMPFTEKTLALANLCLVIYVTGKLFNILKELSYEGSPIKHTQLLQKHAVNR